jgi:cardiolipin synthase
MAARRERSAEPSSAILTVPNLISFARILLIPVYVALILREGTEAAGILLFSAVAATDWVDGVIARRTEQVSELGKLLDPIADRLAIAAGLIALMAAGAFPLWAGLLILIRDGALLVAGLGLLLARRVRIDVRRIGKLATFTLMLAVPWISWGTLHLPLSSAALALGWVAFAIGIVEYYAATALYVLDARDAWRAAGRT